MAKRKKTSRAIPIDDELRQGLEEQLERFRQKFGRGARPPDPVFFDPDADEPRPMDPARLQAQIIGAMQAAGIEPAKIHAYKRTGLLVTAENATRLSAQDREDWRLALEEYRALEERRN
jgi:hypothetical protein